ncbi:MAG: ribonuclease P protein component 4 [Candidatus Bathyarchaeota archaeon]|nr:ribonuclease P protein component 4 [Candidatus Bathyarchaeota archaeon]
MKTRNRKADAKTKNIAMRRIHTLLNLAKETKNTDPTQAQRYAAIARKVAMAAKIRLPKEHRLLICKHCKNLILPGQNCRVRIRQRREPHVTITCLNCGKQTRIPLKKKGS